MDLIEGNRDFFAKALPLINYTGTKNKYLDSVMKHKALQYYFEVIIIERLLRVSLI